ncbi:hypothetical protein ACSQ67_012008 [Phaseolus vulgaris]
MRSQEEIECSDKRRSSRIIALEEKKQQQQRERELELASQRKNNSINYDTINKGKGKVTMEESEDLCNNINEDEERSTKKRRKNKEFYQLISSIKELGRQSTSRTNDSPLNGIPLKNILEIIVDFLQRKDPDELFAEPINPDVVKNYYEIVKQPMDFATVRAKLHENMYTELNLFKRDILLICSNAKNVNPRTSIYHEVGEEISRHAKCIFEALDVVPQYIDLESSLTKRRPGRKPKNGEQKISQRDSTEVEKRDTYRPTSMPLVSEILCGNRPNFQVNENQFKYKESLLQFVKDLGPIVQRVAAKKLEPLQHQQLCIGNSSTQNLLVNASGSQITHQPTPQIPTQQDTLNAQTFPLGLPFHNRSLTIPGSATDKTRNFRGISKGKLDSLVENASSSVGPIQEKSNLIHFGFNKTSNTREWHTSTGIPYMLANGGSTSTNTNTNNVFAPQHPTSIISGLSGNRNSISGLPLMPSTWLEGTMSCMRSNIIESSLVNQPRPRASMYDMPRHNLQELSLVHQPWKTNPMYSMIPSRVTPWSQPMQGGSIPGTSYQALLNAPDFNNSSYTMQANLGQVMHQTAPYTPLATQSFPNMQMQLRQESVPPQVPNSLSAPSLQEASPELLRNTNDEQVNLDLHL